MLDTGSGMSVISEQTAKRLGIKPVAKGGLARAVGGGGKFEIVYGFLESIEIGNAKVSNVPVYIRKFFDSHIPVDGYLGLSVIRSISRRSTTERDACLSCDNTRLRKSSHGPQCDRRKLISR